MPADLRNVIKTAHELELTIAEDAENFRKLALFMHHLADAVALAAPNATSEEIVDLQDDVNAVNDYFVMIQEHVEKIDEAFDSMFDSFVKIDMDLYPEEHIGDVEEDDEDVAWIG